MKLPVTYVLATVHRAENTDDRERLSAIMEGFAESGRTIILPLHPRTKSRLAGFNITVADNIRLIDPVGYLDMVMLEKNASVIATDSGGVQKEAFFHGVPCVTLRDETEWIELVECGWNTLVTPFESAQITRLLSDYGPKPKTTPTFFGDGHSSSRIADLLQTHNSK